MNCSKKLMGEYSLVTQKHSLRVYLEMRCNTATRLGVAPAYKIVAVHCVIKKVKHRVELAQFNQFWNVAKHSPRYISAIAIACVAQIYFGPDRLWR